MPAVSLLDKLISGIEPIFVTPYDRPQSKHPISFTCRLKHGAHRRQGKWCKRVRKTRMMPLEEITNLLIAKQV